MSIILVDITHNDVFTVTLIERRLKNTNIQHLAYMKWLSNLERGFIVTTMLA